MDIERLCAEQRKFLKAGYSYNVKYRIDALKKLYKTIIRHEIDIEKALHEDLGKSPFESYTTEIGLALSEISYMLKHVRHYAKIKHKF